MEAADASHAKEERNEKDHADEAKPAKEKKDKKVKKEKSGKEKKEKSGKEKKEKVGESTDVTKLRAKLEKIDAKIDDLKTQKQEILARLHEIYNTGEQRPKTPPVLRTAAEKLSIAFISKPK